MAIYWQEILPKHPGAEAIVEVKSSQALVDEVRRLGGKPVFWKAGHSLIKAKMRELNALFAGEVSGHMFFADEFFGFDDSFYAAGRLLRALPHPFAALPDQVKGLLKGQHARVRAGRPFAQGEACRSVRPDAGFLRGRGTGQAHSHQRRLQHFRPAQLLHGAFKA